MSMAEDHFTLTKHCTKCGQEKPLTSFQKHSAHKDGLDARCKTCAAARQKAYCEANREKVAAKNKNYREANKKKVAAIQKAYYEANKKKLAANQKDYCKANREKLTALHKAWYKANPEMTRAIKHRRRARKRNAPGTHTAAQIKELLLQQKGKCPYCKTDIRKGYHVDHIVALANGGGNDKYNLQLTCAHCNCSKHAQDHIAFAQQQGMLL